jgi:hypothetical protein
MTSARPTGAPRTRRRRAGIVAPPLRGIRLADDQLRAAHPARRHWVRADPSVHRRAHLRAGAIAMTGDAATSALSVGLAGCDLGRAGGPISQSAAPNGPRTACRTSTVPSRRMSTVTARTVTGSTSSRTGACFAGLQRARRLHRARPRPHAPPWRPCHDDPDVGARRCNHCGGGFEHRLTSLGGE